MSLLVQPMHIYAKISRSHLHRKKMWQNLQKRVVSWEVSTWRSMTVTATKLELFRCFHMMLWCIGAPHILSLQPEHHLQKNLGGGGRNPSGASQEKAQVLYCAITHPHPWDIKKIPWGGSCCREDTAVQQEFCNLTCPKTKCTVWKHFYTDLSESPKYWITQQ